MIYIVLTILVTIVAIAAILIEHHRREALQKQYLIEHHRREALQKQHLRLCNKYHNAIESRIKFEDSLTEALDGIANYTNFSVHENYDCGSGWFFYVYAELSRTDSSCPYLGFTIKKFYYDEDDIDSREYAEICANELCDMLNYDYE